MSDTPTPSAAAFVAVDRDGAPSWDSRVHDTRDAAETAALAANAYFFNVAQPVYVVAEAPPSAVYFAAEQARSQEWIKRHLATIERLRTLVDDHVDTPHTHPDNEGEPDCPACWAADVLQIVKEGRT